MSTCDRSDQNSRKRHLGSNVSATDTNKQRKTSDENLVNMVNIDKATCASLPDILTTCKIFRLEAIFHPKFENEKTSEKSIRKSMKEKVQAGLGYLEVSLKHSGSLLLWSGGQRFYSKNSTDNAFTHAGELLLRQHFVRAYWNESKNDNNNDDGTHLAGDVMYQKCGDYVQKHRLTLSFEVVTAVLGDHGDRPNRDFLILTAVAHRSSKPRFHSTAQIIELAQQFRLPHNDTWMFSTEKSVNALFDFYDGSRETGMADSVVKALTTNADVFIPSMYPHVEFQGNILEGIVIRYVQCEKALNQVKQLAKVSKGLYEKVPPSLEECFDLLKASSSLSTEQNAIKIMPVLLTNLRQVYKASTEISVIEGKLKEVVLSSRSNSSTIQRLLKSGQANKSLLKLVEQLGSTTANNNAGGDVETRKIANLIQSLSNITENVQYTFYQETCKDSSTLRIICIVHVLHDETFQKFHNNMKAGDFPLFRGFSIECIMNGNADILACNEEHIQKDSDIDSATREEKNTIDQSNETLMLKMKFLPYMVRTFGCRNGLEIVHKSGPASFTSYAQNLLTKWGMSTSAKQKWLPFFQSWGEYVHACFTGQPPCEGARNLPPLTGPNYLDHLELFSELFESGELKHQLSDKEKKSSLQGLVVVVSLHRATAEAVSKYISEQVGSANILPYDEITKETMSLSCVEGNGRVCSAVVEDGFGKLRNIAKDYGEFLSIILFGCTDGEIAAQTKTMETKQKRKTEGMLKGWRKFSCSSIFDFSATSLFKESNIESRSFEDTAPTEEFDSMLTSLKKEKCVDNRPGLLVFFPTIPGMGKSSITAPCLKSCELQTALAGKNKWPNRNLILQVGDKIEGKYWPFVKMSRLRDMSSVFIADKNAPFSAWENISKICGATKAYGVPVIPDSTSLRTTKIIGARKQDGTILDEVIHIYPFSLKFLALCLARVLDRPEGSHAGKLDSSTDRACMIVIKFFALYRKLSAENFVDSLLTSFTNGGGLMTQTPIKVPVFRRDSTDEILPKDLEEVLKEALRCQYGYDLNNKDTLKSDPASDDYVGELENRLRTCICKNRDWIVGLSESLEISRNNFLSQLTNQVVCVDTIEKYEVSKEPFVKIASIDVDVKSIHNALLSMKTDESLLPFFKLVAGGKDINAVSDEVLDTMNPENASKLVVKTHITMAHCRLVSQKQIRNVFGPLCGSKVSVTITGLLWSNRIAALAVNLPDQTADSKILPACENIFPHITVWFETGTSAVESNDLPALVKTGHAKHVELESHLEVEGVVSLWSM